jgi:hypothetical protein
MFIGHCIDAREGVAWFIENLERPPRQRDSLMESQVIFEFVNESHSDGTFGAVLSIEWPRHLDISVARAAVASRVCKEIVPLPKIYRSAAEYKGPTIQIPRLEPFRIPAAGSALGQFLTVAAPISPTFSCRWLPRLSA